MVNQFTARNIAVKDLSLWDENARFPNEYFTKSETELIDYFLSSEKSYKIKKLAEAIVKDFDLPQLEKLIVYDYDNNLIVLEGNRRLTVYKLLINPELTTNASLRKYFKDLSSAVSIDENYTIECLVTDDQEQGIRYVDRKHLNGNYEVGWGDAERAHHNARKGIAKKQELLKIEIAKIVRDLDIPEEMKEQILGKGYVTTFFRAVINQSAWDIFGYQLDEDGNLSVSDKDFEDKLKIIIFNVLKKEDFNGERLDSRSLNKTEQKENYLRSLKKDDSKKVDNEIRKSTNEDLFGKETTQITSKSIRGFSKSFSRDHLIPKSCIFKIPEVKINNIYRELRDDLILDDSKKAVPNAVGVLFRVFLEISIDYFLEKEGITSKKDATLSSKITKASDIMDSKNIAKSQQLSNIRKVATDKNNLLSINYFHEYVHSYRSQPSSNDLKLKWDNLQEFFELLWGYLYNKTLT
jgi:hypothetical protein